MNSSRALPFLGLALAGAAIAFCLTVRAQAQSVNFVADFNGGNGWQPFGSVVQATDGNLYGTTASGGIYKGGNVFRMTPDGEIGSIYSFCSQTNCADGQSPQTAPVLGSDGALYGVTLTGGTGEYGGGNGVVYRLTLGGQFTVLHTFYSCYPCVDGSLPNGMILGSDGNFYGTTNYGGTGGVGTIFQISSTGDLKILYSFCSQVNCTDGEYVAYPPVQGNDGNLYGTTLAGGTLGGGVFYKITPAGAYQVLHNFCNLPNGDCPEGAYPYGIVKGTDGNFYGTTIDVVFKITPAGQYTKLYSFDDHGDLGEAYPQLTLGSDGNLYGILGGASYASWAPQSLGGIYKVTLAGEFTPLYAFCQCGSTAGYAPLDPLFQGTDGNFYGTTAYNGYTGTNKFSGYGTVFKLSTGLSPLVETAPAASPIGKTVIILGNGLTGSTSVTFSGVEAAFTVESDTYIQATVPAGATTGVVSVATPSGMLNSNSQFVVTK
jgi:uncharacterized repeat protein (TIGR03803 family)